MYVQKFQSPAGSKIAVTTTAAYVYDLINTAQSTTLNNAGFDNKTNSIDIRAEDGDIRYLFNNQTPTAANGQLLKAGEVAFLRNVPVKSLKLIGVAGTVNCSVQVGLSSAEESSSISAASETPAPPAGGGSSSYLNGSLDVTVAGTAEPLGATATFRTLTVQAKFSNGGNIYLGGSAVTAANGLELVPGASFTFNVAGDIAGVYVDSAVNGEGVTFFYIT